MARFIVVTIIILSFVLTASNANGQQMISSKITLKHNFFSGWKYSLDGKRYRSIGMTGRSLYLAMDGHEAAQQEMKLCRSYLTWSVVSACSGGALLGWCAGAAMYNDWQDTYNYFLAGAGILVITSIALDVTASDHMKKAVRIYNGEETALILGLDYHPLPANQSTGLMFTVSLSF